MATEPRIAAQLDEIQEELAVTRAELADAKSQLRGVREQIDPSTQQAQKSDDAAVRLARVEADLQALEATCVHAANALEAMEKKSRVLADRLEQTEHELSAKESLNNKMHLFVTERIRMTTEATHRACDDAKKELAVFEREASDTKAKLNKEIDELTTISEALRYQVALRERKLKARTAASSTSCGRGDEGSCDSDAVLETAAFDTDFSHVCLLEASLEVEKRRLREELAQIAQLSGDDVVGGSHTKFAFDETNLALFVGVR